jgi:hypothetical protein
MTGFLSGWPLRAKLTVASLLVVLIVLNVAVLPAATRGDRAVASTSTSTSTTVRPSASSTTGTTGAPAPTTSSTTTTTVPVTTQPPTPPPARPDLARLAIDDAAPPGGYDRDLFPTWLDLDLNGCDARDDTLTAESEIPVQRDGCDVFAGRWTSVYDGVVVTDPGQLDVDHMVPLAEAWRSGAHAWDTVRRAEFANSLDDPDHLVAVTAATNRSKSDSPPDQWRPGRQETWCWYATAWITIKVTWSLTATTTERDALGQMLDTC